MIPYAFIGLWEGWHYFAVLHLLRPGLVPIIRDKWGITVLYTSCTRVGWLKKFRSIQKVECRSNKQFKDCHEFQRRLHFREDWVLWRTFSIGKWRVDVFKANHAFEEFEGDHEFQRRLHFREDFISEKIGYSGERFRSGNEEWMCSKPTTPSKSSKMTTSFREDFISEKTSFQRRFGTLENVFDREMKSECIQSQPRLRRVRRQPWVLEKTLFQRRLHFGLWTLRRHGHHWNHFQLQTLRRHGWLWTPIRLQTYASNSSWSSLNSLLSSNFSKAWSSLNYFSTSNSLRAW